MTKEQEILARMRRLDGKSISEVSERLGIPEEEVATVYSMVRYKKSIIGSERTKYIRLDQWMRQNGVTRTMFANKVGIHYATLCNIMDNDVDVCKRHIDKILKYTGLTYEEAFGVGGELT